MKRTLEIQEGILVIVEENFKTHKTQSIRETLHIHVMFYASVISKN